MKSTVHVYTLNLLTTPTYTGPGKEIYMKGAGGAKGHDGSDEKLYCQVAIEKRETLFINDPSKVPGLEKNEDWVKFGYGYYVGAPWTVGQTTGEGICSCICEHIYVHTHTHSHIQACTHDYIIE